MARAILKIEISAGSDILSAFEEAVRLAELLRVTIEFKFNEVTCLANGDGNPIKGERNYLEIIETDRQYKIISC